MSSHKAEFYRKDVEVEGKGGVKFVKRDILHFRSEWTPNPGGDAPEVWDGPATEQQMKQYSAQLKKFLSADDKTRVVAKVFQVVDAEVAPEVLPQAEEVKELPEQSAEVEKEVEQVLAEEVKSDE